MADIELLCNTELMIVQAQGETDAGIAFIDGYIPERTGADYSVIDSGRILFPQKDANAFERAVQERGLTFEKVTQP